MKLEVIYNMVYGIVIGMSIIIGLTLLDLTWLALWVFLFFATVNAILGFLHIRKKLKKKSLLAKALDNVIQEHKKQLQETGRLN